MDVLAPADSDAPQSDGAAAFSKHSFFLGAEYWAFRVYCQPRWLLTLSVQQQVITQYQCLSESNQYEFTEP